MTSPFIKDRNQFQKHLDIIVKDITKSNQIFVKSDKTTFFLLNKFNTKYYTALMKNNLTKNY